MGCVHTTGETQDDREGAGKNVHENCEHNYKPQKSVNSIQNDISNSDVTVKSENVTLKEINFKEVDGEQNSSLMYQISVLNASDIESRGSGSSLSLSDLDTYRKKRFPKWRGYRKCKYCMQDESLQSSFRSSYDTGSFAESSGTSETKQESDKGKRSKMRSDQSRPTPRGLPSRDSCRRCSTKVTKNSNQRNNTTNNNRGGTTSQFINLLAINALDLTAPASDALLKNRKNAWVQLAGHPGSFAPAGPDTIWKKRLTKDNREVKAYQALMNDPAREVVPTFHREVEFNGDFFIEMEDLLHHFHDPNIMDIKMGCRTFLEAEVKNPVLRTDLYEKMVKIDPDAPTEEEHAQKAITKLRYMQFREHESSTASLGFRLEAIRVSGQTPVTDLKKVKNRDEVAVVIARFISGKETIRKTILDKLIHIRQCFEDSDFFRTHELIGSSLLVMFDKRGVSGVWMIDFAKTLAVDRQLSHRALWMLGNHEDGYLTGLDNLIKIFETLTFTSTEMIDNLSFVPDQTQANEVT